MFITKKRFKRLQDYVEILQKDVMRTRNWHECKNCTTIFNRESLITSRFNFDYCAACRPIMKEKQELDNWVSQNQTSVQLLKNDI